eukprot:Amastigsp_a339197_494.p1 type:complete len:393 gc:universal Amastigsp_a339197_494:1286-108(-)
MDVAELALDLELEDDSENIAQRAAHKAARAAEIAASRQAQERDWASVFPRYPSADDGFMVSFEPSETEAIRSTMERFGVVVVRVLSREQAEATAQEALDDATAHAAAARVAAGEAPGLPISRDNPLSWESSNWPAPRSKFLFSEPAFTRRAFENRTCDAVYEAFRALYGGEHRLWSSIDNWGVMRPTVVGGVEREEWRTELAPHWDVNPFTSVHDAAAGVLPRFQGLVALVDCPVEVGTFVAVPGSHRFLPEWCSHRTPSTSTQSMRPKRDDIMCRYTQPIPLRAGEIVIWRFELVHANVANRCERMRLVQFIRMMPAYPRSVREDKYAPARVWDQFPGARQRVERELAPAWTQLQRRLLGLEDWDSRPHDPLASETPGPADDSAHGVAANT